MVTHSSKAPWGDSPEIEWDDENEAHATAHGVSVSEIEELVYCGEYDWWRHPQRSKKTKDKFSNRYLIRGTTLGGLKVILVVDRIADCKLRPVTALKEA